VLCTGIQGTLPGVAAPSIQAQLYRLEQHYHLQKEMLSRQFEEEQRLLEHEKQQYKMQVQYMLIYCRAVLNILFVFCSAPNSGKMHYSYLAE